MIKKKKVKKKMNRPSKCFIEIQKICYEAFVKVWSLKIYENFMFY